MRQFGIGEDACARADHVVAVAVSAVVFIAVVNLGVTAHHALVVNRAELLRQFVRFSGFQIQNMTVGAEHGNAAAAAAHIQACAVVVAVQNAAVAAVLRVIGFGGGGVAFVG